MQIRPILFLVLMTFFSCESKLVYNEFDSNFDENRWVSNESNSFSFTIEKENVCDIVLHLGHIYDLQFDSIPLEVRMTNPDGVAEIKTIDLKLKDANGKDLAECSGDICDLYYTIKERVTLQKGKHTIEITNKFASAYLPNILGVGLQIKK